MKKIYSLNLMAFITMETGVVPQFERDGKLISALYPETPDIKEAIAHYRDSNTIVNLHSFLSQFKELKQLIREA